MTEREERRYCQWKGCRSWWVVDPTIKLGGRPRRFCKPCQYLKRREKRAQSPEERQRRLAASRESIAALRDDRVGLRVDHPRYPTVPCERCLERPARKRFSFCMKCSVCARCGKNKPEIGRWNCRACRLSWNSSVRARLKLPGVKEARDAYMEAYRNRTGVKEVLSERRKKLYNSDSRYREKVLARNRIAFRFPERVAAMARRVCAQPGCTKRLAGKRIGTIYCSRPCKDKMRRKVYHA